MTVSCTVFEIKRDVGGKTLIFHTPLYLTCTITFGILPKILVQTARVPELLGGANIGRYCKKVQVFA